MLRSDDFYLRHPRKDEWDTLAQLINDVAQRGRFLSQEVYLPGVLEKKFAEQYQSKEQMEMFVIVDYEEQILGRIFHFKTVPYFNSREIGYALFQTKEHGKGMMTKAVSMLVDYLFQTTLINRLEIHMEAGNKASERVAQKCGFQLDGVAREACFNRGQHQDVLMYSLLRREWQEHKD